MKLWIDPSNEGKKCNYQSVSSVDYILLCYWFFFLLLLLFIEIINKNVFKNITRYICTGKPVIFKGCGYWDSELALSSCSYYICFDSFILLFACTSVQSIRSYILGCVQTLMNMCRWWNVCHTYPMDPCSYVDAKSIIFKRPGLLSSSHSFLYTVVFFVTKSKVNQRKPGS